MRALFQSSSWCVVSFVDRAAHTDLRNHDQSRLQATMARTHFLQLCGRTTMTPMLSVPPLVSARRMIARADIYTCCVHTFTA
jgi:hypothetical protein